MVPPVARADEISQSRLKKAPLSLMCDGDFVTKSSINDFRHANHDFKEGMTGSAPHVSITISQVILGLPKGF